MSLTTLTVDVANVSSPKRTKTLEFIVDSGAIYPVVPARTLKELGIKPIAEHEFRLADGSTIRRKKGIAMFRYKEYVGGADVIFGEKGDYTLFRALGLEALGLALHPLKRELRPLPMILA